MTTQAFLFAPGRQTSTGSFTNTLSGMWVQDSAGNVYWLETATDTDGNVTYTYYDQPGGTVQVPVGSVEPIKPNNLQVIKRGDDINSDGSVIITFYRVNVYDDNGDIIASTPQTATGLPYVIQGTEVDPADEVEDLLNDANTIATGNAASNATTASNTGTANALLTDIEVNTDRTAVAAESLDGRTAGSFINFAFDEVDLTYVAAGPAQGEIETAVYKLATVTVGTITITYDGVGNISNISRS